MISSMLLGNHLNVICVLGFDLLPLLLLLFQAYLLHVAAECEAVNCLKVISEYVDVNTKNNKVCLLAIC